ncbi:MAG: YggS family pyridoxal phosphate-dependent enzyme [Synergistaceae bacterium]|nr:YggS family pyridoxal phosphate-dependent enzyme [Synergistaceae bacterium]
MIKENIEIIRQKIEKSVKISGRKLDEVRLMGVTKYHSLDEICEAAPFLDFIGENKVQEAEKKKGNSSAPRNIPWHMIGHMQRNKIKKAVEIFDLIETIDNIEAADTLQNVLAKKEASPFPIFIEVNVTGEESKNGIPSVQAENLLCHILKNCSLVIPTGLMTMAREVADEHELHKTFATARMLRDTLEKKTGARLPELSMGMSGDFEIAIEEGSTIVRVGTSIFGIR